MIIKWKTRNGHAEIQAVECTRATDYEVFMMCDVGFQRHKAELSFEKHSYFIADGVSYHDSWENAHKHLSRYAVTQEADLRAELSLAEANTAELKAMRGPVPT